MNTPMKPPAGGPQGSLAAAPRDRAIAWLMLACAAVFLGSLGLYPLFDDDEGAFSEATREILDSGDWLSTTLNGAPRYDKPILIYWLQALSVRIFGLDEFALRLPSALAALAWIYAIVRFAAPRWGRACALLAGGIAASSLGLLAMGRAATADALLNALIAASLFDLWRHLEGVLRGGAGDRAALRRAYLWIGLGLLAKGPIAGLIPAAVGLGTCLATARRRAVLRSAADPLGWLLLLGVSLPWYVLQWRLHGQAFVEGFFVHHNLERFHGPLEGHGGSLFYYAIVAPALLLPWTALLWRGARDAWQARRDPLTRYLLLWFGFVFVFFSLSGTKLPHYVLYGMTPLFLLLARSLAQGGGSWRNTLVLPLASLLALLALPAALGAWLATHPLGVPLNYAALGARSRSLAGTQYYAVTAGAALLALAALVLQRWPLWRRAALAGAALAVALCFAFTPWLGALLQGPVKTAAFVSRQWREPAVQWNFSAPSFSVYRQSATPARPPQPGELAITRIDRLDPRIPVDVLFAQGGVLLVQRRGAPGAGAGAAQ